VAQSSAGTVQVAAVLDRVRRAVARRRPAGPPIPPDLHEELTAPLDLAYYRRRYRDLAELDDAGLTAHFRLFGTAEGRHGTPWAEASTVVRRRHATGRPGVVLVVADAADGSEASVVSLLEQLARTHDVAVLALTALLPPALERLATTVVYLAPDRAPEDGEGEMLLEHLPELARAQLAVVEGEAHGLAVALERSGVPVVAVLRPCPQDPLHLASLLTTASVLTARDVADADALHAQQNELMVRTVRPWPADPSTRASWLVELGRAAGAGPVGDRRDVATILDAGQFSPTLFAWTRPIPPTHTLVAEYVRRSRLAAPRARPRTGLVVRRPTEGFHPLVYAEQAPGYDDERDGDPYADYLRRGSPPGPWAVPVIRETDQVPGPGDPLPRVLVHGHFHYPELVGELAALVGQSSTPVTLVATTGRPASAAALRDALDAAGRGDALVQVVENAGRNLGALFSGLDRDLVAAHDVVLHVHGKRSPHAGADYGDNWRRYLWAHLVGGRMLDRVVRAFAADPTLGVVAAEDPNLNCWDVNRPYAEQLATRLGLRVPLTTHFDFPLGGMFWARTAALRAAFEARLRCDEYPPEPLPPDGSMLHALERLVPFIARDEGFSLAKTAVSGVER